MNEPTRHEIKDGDTLVIENYQSRNVLLAYFRRGQIVFSEILDKVISAQCSSSPSTHHELENIAAQEERELGIKLTLIACSYSHPQFIVYHVLKT